MPRIAYRPEFIRRRHLQAFFEEGHYRARAECRQLDPPKSHNGFIRASALSSFNFWVWHAQSPSDGRGDFARQSTPFVPQSVPHVAEG
jgi:hypothetical protein